MYIIFPIDDSTNFLQVIADTLIDKFGAADIHVIRVDHSDEGYSESLKEIENIASDETILFMGHGQENCLYGGESKTFDKKPLIKNREIEIFAGKNVFLLACDSNAYLRSTFKFSKVTASIGFGGLPTDIGEVKKRLLEQGVNDAVIERFKLAITQLVVDGFSYILENNLPFHKLSDYFMLYLNKMISNVVLAGKEDFENRALADLLFKMKSEMVFI
ncbi:hypothetical protein [Mucilaginibacter gossypii]|uniref:CHAT domain-containing protein n=1 Tax=Mucilaginibacter gossypii TaxID=551996 RepID=A0A1G8CYV4_9SPHI|nr:hypothetical protein [Mucilaginibacter gossypii]SDH50393.1 hypothetical protein SAMN05192573_11071 [Mucilaginibacter gossypii]